MKKLIGIALLFTFWLTADAQTPFFQEYTPLKKNEAVQVNTLFQDHAGIIWFGTNKGLFRFNGINYQQFGKRDSLSDDNITAVAEDSLGRLWIGHANGNLSYRSKNIFKTFKTSEGPAAAPISQILFDKKGVLWFSTLNDGLYYYRRDRLFRLDEANGMPDLYIYAIAEDQHGAIWAGTDRGVAVCNLKDTVAIKVISHQHGLPDNIIKKITVATDGKIWMATDNAGVVIYDPVTNAYQPLSRNGWPHGSVTDFNIKGNKVWIASNATGLFVYDRASNHSALIDMKALPGIRQINCLLQDREGNIWTGSKLGVMRTSGDNLEYVSIAGASMDNSVVALAIDSQMNIWWANREGLFKRTINAEGEVTSTKQLAHAALAHYTITSLYVDAEGYIWAGLYGEGAFRINPVNGSVRHLQAELRNGNVLNITGRGNITWLSTLEGVAQITSIGDHLDVKNYGSKEGLSSDYIYQTFIDSRNRVWFATDGKGVDMKDEKGIHHFEQGLNAKIVYGFAEDSDHHVWINVGVEGIFRFDDNKFSPLPSDLTLRDRNISCLSSDKGGNLVIMHDLGIEIFDVRRNKLRFFGEEAGIREKQPNLNAANKDVQGNIYFGTSNGIVIYSNPGDVKLADPSPLIDQLKVLDKDVDISGDLELSYNKNYITISYLGIWYQNPENLYYQTKLENYDRDWIARRDHAVTYSSLPPGEYKFRLRVSDTDNFTNAPETSIIVTIHPPFWRTTWFYFLIAFAIVVLGYLIISYRERRLVEDKRELEAKVTERTLEIQRKTEEIQAQNEEIHSQAEEIKGINENLEHLVKERTLELIKKNKALEEYAFITAHNLRAPVASVLGLINLASKIETDDESRIIIAHLKTSAEKLDAIVRSITLAIEKGDTE